MNACFAAVFAVLLLAATPAEEPGGVGTIRGRVIFEGVAPPAVPPAKSLDPECKAGIGPPASLVISKNRGIVGALVRLPAGAARGVIPDDDPVLEHKVCRKHPAILPIASEHEVELVNRSATLHNVHAFDGKTSAFNVALPPDSSRTLHPEVPPGTALRVTCDVHPGEESWIVTSDHPFVQLTSEDGEFELDLIPAGKYAVEAFHPLLGWQKTTVTVKPGATTRTTITFAPAAPLLVPRP